MSELPPGVAPAEPPVPRDSASAVVVRRVDGEWELLLGLRSRKARFMPSHLACPGGVMEPEDGGSFERCASRELEEESGVAIAASSWLAAGQRTTPPMFPVRFRTRFFVAGLPAGSASPSPATPENESLRFARPADVIDEWTAGDARIPPPVLPIVRALAAAGGGSDLAEIARLVTEANLQEERAPRIEFAPGVWMLPVKSATLPPATHTNVWMPGGREFVVIDPGSADPDENARLLEVVARRRALGGKPVAILLTHHHQDHTRGIGAVAGALRLPLRAHEETLAAIGGDAAAADCIPLAGGERIDLGGMTLTAHHTPGHAAGHLAFHLEPASLLIAGDLVSGLSTILIDPQQGDMPAYLASLTRAAALGCKLLFPGHGPPLPGRQLTKLIDHRLERERRILEAVERGATRLAAIADAAYADTPGLPRALIEGQTLAHLRGLAAGAKLVERDGSWQLGHER